MLKPKLIILDEIDSGLDIDALKTICIALKKLTEKNKNTSILVITHYPRILNHLEPDFVHVMKDGAIVQSGTKELAEQIEHEGYNLRSE
jgi:Fe-S cluster assembly ATP-binding protein